MVYNFFLIFASSSICVMLLTALKLVIHIWDLLDILIFPWLSKLFPHRRLCNLFTFFFLLSGAQYRTPNNSNNNNNNNNNNKNNNNNFFKLSFHLFQNNTLTPIQLKH